MPTTTAPALWGGYAEMLYLAPASVIHAIDRRIPARIAALYNPFGAGFAWAVEAPGLRLGQSVAIFGPGQRGLACVIAARLAGPIVLAGIKGRGRGVDCRSFRQTIALIESGRAPIGRLHTHHSPLEDAARAVRTLTASPDRPAISITIEP
jgi:threonine dehydrogenase-like Zn-dependent dehydrogenase